MLSYPTIKLLHVALVVCRGLLFAARGAGVLARQTWPMQKVARWASRAFDMALMTAGITLWALLSLNPVSQPTVRHQPRSKVAPGPARLRAWEFFGRDRAARSNGVRSRRKAQP